MITAVPKASLTFLKDLKKNNTREWMAEHKSRYQYSEKILKDLYATIKTGLNETDDIEKLKVFRINRDIRFSKDKTLITYIGLRVLVGRELIDVAAITYV
jgi:uncharacterized protein (DUF2461 family)